MKISTIKLADSIKPPARKSEIIEALSIRKRDQIISDNLKLQKELKELEDKLQIVCAEEMAKTGRLNKNKYNRGKDFSCRAEVSNAGHVVVGEVTCSYSCQPTEEIRKIAKQIRVIKNQSIYKEPSLHEVRQQVRASISEQTQPDKRIHSLLNDPESQKMLDAMLDTLDGKPKALEIKA